MPRSEELTTKQTAEYLAKHNWPLKVSTLNTYRTRDKDKATGKRKSKCKGPKPTKKGHRVIYLKPDIDAFIESNEIKKFSPD